MQYITVKAASLGGARGEAKRWARGQTRATDQFSFQKEISLIPSQFNLLISYQGPQLEVALPPSFISYLLMSFSDLPPLSSRSQSVQFGARLEPTAVRGRRRKKGKRKKRKKEGGGIEADACDSVGAVMRVPTTERQSVRPEHTERLHAHMHKTARE